MKQKFYITTPIYYVNDYPHLGHAYTTVVADAIARFKRAQGADVFFLTGTDEHGQKVEKSARNLGITPQELADRVVSNYHLLWKQLGIEYSRFIRTTEQAHMTGVQRIFETIREKGDIYPGEYEGWYCTSCEKYIGERESTGRACPDCGKETEILKEPCYFFRLSKYQQPLLDLYRNRPTFVQPKTRYNEVVSFVEGGLRDLSISRSTIRWGVPAPGDDSQVIYVWFDALNNYLTGVGYGTDDATFERWWPASIHLVGKDIVRFHAVYWPAFLMSLGVPLPETVFAHGWWLQDERKMSKSVGNVVGTDSLIQKFGPEPLRYFLLREVPLGLDSNFSEEAVRNRYNYDLANDLGNLNSRVQKLLVTAGAPDAGRAAPAGEAELGVREKYYDCRKIYVEAFNDYQPSRALAAVWEFVSSVNQYVATCEPWALLKRPDGRPRLERVLLTCAESLRLIALFIEPAMPKASETIAASLRAGGEDTLEFRPERPWDIHPRATALFPRIEEQKEVKKMEEAKLPAPTAAPAPELISIEEFQKVHLRVAEVKSAERVAGAKKLLKLVVDIGTETRQIVAGIAESYEPEQLVGKKIIVVTNLKPALLRGVESQGMLLAATVDGRPIVATFEGNPPAGAVVR